MNLDLDAGVNAQCDEQRRRTFIFASFNQVAVQDARVEIWCTQYFPVSRVWCVGVTPGTYRHLEERNASNTSESSNGIAIGTNGNANSLFLLFESMLVL